MEYFCQDQAFHMAISMAQRQHLWKKNWVLKNIIYSITNQYIDLKFLGDMNWYMARIFVTANFSGKCLLIGATFNFWRKVRSGPSSWWPTWGPWSGPYTGHFRSSEKISGTQHLSNMFANTTGLYLFGFVNCHWLRKVFDYHEASFWVARCIYILKRQHVYRYRYVNIYIYTSIYRVGRWIGDCFLRTRRRHRWGAVSRKISEFH